MTGVTAQEMTTPTTASDSVTLPIWAVLVGGLGVTVFGAGGLYVLDRALSGLKASNPPGTVEEVTKPIGATLERLIEYLERQAPTTETPIDDFLLKISGPLADAIIDRLKGDSATAEMWKPPKPPLN